MSGLSDSEAQEFHKLFMSSFIGFTLVAIVAHILVWQWRPWLPGTDGYSSAILDGAKYAANQLISALV